VGDVRIPSGNSYELNASGTTWMREVSANIIQFYANGAERMRIDGSTGNVGIGTTSPGVKLETAGLIRSNGSTLLSGFQIINNGSDSGGMFSESCWKGSGSSNNLAISAYSGNKISFFHNGGSTEAMTISTSGLVGIGTTSPVASNKLTIDNGSDSYGLVINSTADAGLKLSCNGTNHTFFAGSNTVFSLEHTNSIQLRTNNANRLIISNVGRVRMPEVYNVAGTGSALYIESDGNLFRIVSAGKYKDNIRYHNVDGNAVYQLRPISYTLKAKPDAPEQIGFLAEDVEQVERRLVYHNDEGEPDSLYYDRINVLLVAAAQDLQQRLTALEARLAVLEG